MKYILNQLRLGGTLTRVEAATTLTKILASECPAEQTAAFLTFFSARLPTLDEFSGFHEVLTQQGVKVELGEGLLDLCGTGGDQKDTFNISTTAAFVVAGAGYKVAKHGNYSASSSCGSSTVLEVLGLRFTVDQSQLHRHLDTAGLCVLHAPLFQPGLRAIAPIRKNLGIPTFFNLLGPLVNPASPSFQIVGVASPEVLQLMRFYLADLPGVTAIHCRAGYDEFSLLGACDAVSNGNARTIYPEDMQLQRVRVSELSSPGGSPEAAQLIVDILSGDGTRAQRAVVTANAAMAICTAEPRRSLPDCAAIAEESIRSGRALKVLRTLQS